MSEISPSTTRAVYGRVDGKKYCELPDGHRTTFVTGMADMLECLPAAALEYNLVALKHSSAARNLALEFMRTLESDQLRLLFDRYMAEDPARQTYMTASSFLAMLTIKSRASQPIQVPRSGLFQKLRALLKG